MAPADTSDIDADSVIVAARRWIGTPYHRRGCKRGSGADCLGLLRGIWADLYGTCVGDIPVYSDDWLETGRRDLLIERLDQTLEARTVSPLLPGHVLAFRFGRNNLSKHVGIVSALGGSPKFIHAYCRFGVVETTLDPTWQRRISAQFAFPARSI